MMRHLVVDPITMQLTHLVVEPDQDGHRAHLVPFGAIHPEATVGHAQIVVLWTHAEVDAAPLVEPEDFVAIAPTDFRRCGIESDVVVRAWPFFLGGESSGALAYPFGVGRGRDDATGPRTVTTRILGLPSGTIEVGRDSDVITGDELLVGSVDGFVVDPGRGITHAVLTNGHDWHGRDVAIPIGEVSSATRDRAQLACPRAAIELLPGVAFRRFD